MHGSFRPKPSQLMLRTMLARERIRAADAVLIEDSARNLKSARALGLQDGADHPPWRGSRRGGGWPEVTSACGSTPCTQLARRTPR